MTNNGGPRPRVICPKCKRCISITFPGRKDDAKVRTHNTGTAENAPRCAGSQVAIPARWVNIRIAEAKTYVG